MLEPQDNPVPMADGNCPQCAYDLRGQPLSSNGNVRCPECGLWYNPRLEQSLRHRNHRRARGALWGAPVLPTLVGMAAVIYVFCASNPPEDLFMLLLVVILPVTMYGMTVYAVDLRRRSVVYPNLQLTSLLVALPYAVVFLIMYGIVLFITSIVCGTFIYV